jgi:hypothetical protein
MTHITQHHDQKVNDHMNKHIEFFKYTTKECQNVLLLLVHTTQQQYHTYTSQLLMSKYQTHVPLTPTAADQTCVPPLCLKHNTSTMFHIPPVFILRQQLQQHVDLVSNCPHCHLESTIS